MMILSMGRLISRTGGSGNNVTLNSAKLSLFNYLHLSQVALISAVDQLVALESEMQRARQQRARAEISLQRMVLRHGDVLPLDPGDTRNRPTYGHSLLTTRLGQAEQCGRLLAAENAQLLNQQSALHLQLRSQSLAVQTSKVGKKELH
jgi:hypothetical protein